MKSTFNPEDGFLFEDEVSVEPEDCLGMHFNSAEERREYFRNQLRKKLKDPDFRAIEGFPLGDDEDIIALSDPPYYCACPNPWTTAFVDYWESKKKKSDEPYKREPFASDVSEGKNDPIYNAHTYHTKVPHKAIMRYILHYTNPGDIVYDGFCGTGMTAVAAELCGDANEVASLGYGIDSSGAISNEMDNSNEIISQLGKRYAVINDLSPAATFIAANSNRKSSLAQFDAAYSVLKKRIDDECGYLYETDHVDGSKGIINYCIWSDVYTCPNCGREIIYFNNAYKRIEIDKYELNPFILCDGCGSKVSKSDVSDKQTLKLEPVIDSKYDSRKNKTVSTIKRVPVLINYSVGTKRFTKEPDENDIKTILKVSDCEIDSWYPNNPMMGKGEHWGDTWRAGYHYGINDVDQFYVKRTLYVLSKIKSLIGNDSLLNYLFGSFIPKLTILNRYMPQHGSRALVGPMANTLYVPPISTENNPIKQMDFQYRKIRQTIRDGESIHCLSTQSMQSVLLKENSIDYIFLDPPFGKNIMYSELNYIRESWLCAFTNTEKEAIENESQNKGIGEYYSIMHECFKNAFRVLKPGHWITVEFSNTQSEVWNSIQIALSNVGFVIASVSALDKKRGGLHAMIGPVSVKQDLVISAYKPDESFDARMKEDVGTEAVWTFVRKHLDYLPLLKHQNNSIITVPERDARIIYDRMISFFVSHNMLIPIDSPDFLREMHMRFAERNGLYYLADQVQKYDRIMIKQQIFEANSESASLFVCDENSAIAWIRAQLKEKPMTLGEMTPLFMQELSSWNKGEKKPELRDLLEQNFLCYNGKEDVPSFIHGWISTMYKDLRNKQKDDPALRDKAKGRWYVPDPNKESDLAKIREKSLLRDFEVYKNSKGKIKEFRLEAIRAGFKKAWADKDYMLIKSISERMPQNVVEEDEKILMWYNNALTRLGM